MSNQSATVSFTPPVDNGGTPITSYTATSSPGGIQATGAASPIVVSGLTNGVAYTFTVTAHNAVGTGPASTPSNTVIPATVPSTMAAPVAVPGNAQAVVSFVAPSNGGKPITGYRVTASPGGAIATGTGSPLTVTGLINGTSYIFTVFAMNAVGNGASSPPSTSVIPATVPATMIAPTAVRGNAQATVSFVPPANGGSPITGYSVVSTPTGVTQTGGSSPIVISGLANGTSYTFTVKATNAIGTGSPSPASNSVTPATIPATMTAPIAVGGNAQATVSFTAPANGGSPITSYLITSTPGGFTGSGGSSPIIVAGLTNGTSYTFSATANNALGASAPSPPSNAVVPASGGALVGAGSHIGAINFPSGFAGGFGGVLNISGSVALVGTALNLTSSTSPHQANGLWSVSKQNISRFTTDFTFQLTPSGTPQAQGFGFVIQNTTSPPSASGFSGIFLALDSNMCGIGVYDLPSGQNVPIPVFGLKFDLNPLGWQAFPGGASFPSSIGLYPNGGPYGQLLPYEDTHAYAIDFYSGHLFAAHIDYDGTTLTLTLRDTTTNAQLRSSYPADIPTLVGGNTAWVGFGSGEIPPNPNYLRTWTFRDGTTTYTRLPTPTFTPSPGQYGGTQSVTINNVPIGASTYYTTNGLEPTTSSTLYTGAGISVSTTQAVKAVFVQSGFTDSLVGVGGYQISNANVINLGSGFAANDGMILNGCAVRSGSTILLTDTVAPTYTGLFGKAGSAWYATPVPVSTFTTSFQLKFTSAAGNGLTFCLQNKQPASLQGHGPFQNSWVIGGPLAIAGGGSGLGYAAQAGTGTNEAGLSCSVAIAFDLFTVANSVGLYTNGVLPTGSQIATGLAFNGGTFNVVLTYDGTTLSISMQSTGGGTTFTHSWVVDIPSILGGSTGYAGFTAGTGGSSANQSVLFLTYHP